MLFNFILFYLIILSYLILSSLLSRIRHSGTTIDFTLDQLFIHLDDPLSGMQTAVFNVILIASKLDSPLVIKKAKNARLSQRTPDLCDNILYEVQGFELLPDEK